MAIQLSAVFRVRDLGSAQLSRLTRNMQQTTRVTQQIASATDTYNISNGRLRNSLSQFVSQASNASSATSRFSTAVSGLQGSSHSATSSLSGLHRALIGVAGAYLSAQAGKSAFDATIGQAMNFEVSEAIIKSTFRDDGKTKKYMDMVDKIAIDSPLLNSGDMFAGSKGLLTLSTDMGQLEKAWGLVERLIASDPTKSIDEAIRGLREISSGDTISLRDVFNLDKNILNDVKELSFEDQLKGIDKALTKMNITSATVEAMGSTSKGLWTQITERVSKFFREVGGDGNDVLGKQFKKTLDMLDKFDLSAIASNLGSKLVAGMQSGIDAIAFIKGNLDEFKAVLGFVKESVIALTAAFVAHKVILGGFVLYKTIATFMTVYRTSLSLATAAQAAFNTTLFANPIGLIIGSVAALIGITVYLIRNWETVTATAERVWAAIGGGSGAIALVLGPIGFLINAGVDLAKNWDSTKSIWENVWSSIQRSAATSVNAVIGLINSLIETINKIPGIEIGTIGKVDWGNTKNSIASYSMPANPSSGITHSHYHGLDNVPYDSYQASLHKGERVLTAQENKEYSQGGGSSAPVINIAKMEVRKETDIEDIAYRLAKLIESERLQRGYA